MQICETQMFSIRVKELWLSSLKDYILLVRSSIHPPKTLGVRETGNKLLRLIASGMFQHWHSGFEVGGDSCMG